MKRIRIYHIAPALSKTGGGIAEALLNLCQVQVKAGLCVSVFGGDSTYPDEKLAINYSVLNFSSMRTLYNELRNIKDNNVVIHIHGAWSFSFTYVFFLLVFLNSKVKVIFQGHGLLAKGSMLGKSYCKKYIAWHAYQKHIFLRSKFIIVTSKTEIRDLSWCDPEINRINIIPLGISEEFFSPIDDSIIRSTSLLFMSQIIPIKGLDILINAIKKVKTQLGIMISLDICGYGEPSYIQSLNSLVLNNDLKDQIRFIGPVSRDDRVELLDKYNLFVLPSKNESFGLVVVEALSRGCKILTTKNTPWASKEYNEFIDVVELDVDSLMQALKIYHESLSYISDTDTSTRQSFVRKKFDWGIINSQILELYNK